MDPITAVIVIWGTVVSAIVTNQKRKEKEYNRSRQKDKDHQAASDPGGKDGPGGAGVY